MQPYTVTLDITDQVPGLSGTLLMSAWIFVPHDQAKGIVFCLGSKTYYHLVVPGYPEDSYSFALFMAHQGWLVIALDPLGFGESTPVAQEILTMEMLACANEMAFQHILVCLLHDGFDFRLPKIEYPSVTLCVGHGKGAMLAITQQARYRQYDALVVAGWSNYQQSLGNCEAALSRALNAQGGSRDLFTEAVRPENFFVASFALQPFLYAADVPSEVMKADERQPLDVLRNLASPPNYAVMQRFAALIDVPLLLCLAEKDVTNNLLAEAALYPWSPLVEMFLLHSSAHLHNVAGTRHYLWTYMNGWFDQILGHCLERKTKTNAE